MRCIFLLTTCLALCSCATMFNPRTTNILVRTDRPVTVTVDGNSYEVKKKKRIEVLRQDKDLVVAALADTLRQGYRIQPQNSYGYYNNIFTLGLGFLWDNGPKRYGYPSNLYIDFEAPDSTVTRFVPTFKGQTNLTISIPYINTFKLKPEGEPIKINTGFWGLAVGLDKYYRTNKFVNLTLTAATDFFVPVPAAVTIEGEYERMSSVYLSLTNNRVFNRWSIGYGLNYSWNTWTYYEDYLVSDNSISKPSQSIGLTLNGYFRVSHGFHLGLIYRPTLLRVQPATEFLYEHLITLDLLWRIRLNRKK